MKRSADGTEGGGSAKKARRWALPSSPPIPARAFELMRSSQWSFIPAASRRPQRCRQSQRRSCAQTWQRGACSEITLLDANTHHHPCLLQTAEEIARKRAEIAAKFAAMKNPAARPAIPSVVPAPPPSLPPEPAAGLDPDLTRKVAEARKKVMAMAEKAKNPYLVSSLFPEVTVQGAQMDHLQTGPAASTPASAGPSSAGIHPLLMAQETTATPYNRYKPMVPKFATVKVSQAGPLASEYTDHRTHAALFVTSQANFKQTPQPAPRYESPAAAAADAEDKRKNPYFDARLGEGAGPRERAHRSMKFNAKGKFIRLGEQARSEARLEELKQRIAESSRKAGLEDEMQTVEKQVRVRVSYSSLSPLWADALLPQRAPPPEVEWWDEDYLPNKTYDDVLNGEAAKRIRSADSPITIYIQHPIQLPAPGEKNKVELNPLKLTKKEMKKMRRQKRREVQQDKQDRQKMGLLPPPPPKGTSHIHIAHG